VFIGVQRVAVRTKNEIVDRGVETFLVRATDKKDAGVFHSRGF
jgi:hypothetical protein